VVGSDTLFAALVHAANMLGVSEEFICAGKERKLFLSSLFPEDDSGKCLLPILEEDGLVWQVAENPVTPRLVNSGKVAPPPPERRRRAALEPLTREATPFSEMLENVQVARFWVGIDPVLEAHLNTCLHLLEDSGIGGGRSIGRGRFIVLERREIFDPRPQSGEGRLLSLAVPVDEKEEEACQRFALWVDRNGYTEEAYSGSANRRRYGLWAIGEGTLVPFNLCGGVIVLDPEKNIVHYGLAFVAAYRESV
jgi:CRISPR/Cas system CSM-associated protein Csm4 (group 5 of RAMP superfamily)